MIDIENDVYDHAESALKAAHGDIYVTSEYVQAPSEFPAVSIVEMNNMVYERARTRNIENAARVTFECNVYSNKAANKKSEAKEIAETLDDAFSSIGFTRTFKNPVPNMMDASIYRIVLRYEAIVDKDLWIYHNNT